MREPPKMTAIYTGDLVEMATSRLIREINEVTAWMQEAVERIERESVDAPRD